MMAEDGKGARRKVASRRDFLRAAAVAGAGVGAVPAVAAARKTRDWTQQADVIVVGTGAAALSAAVAAVRAGSSVLIVEKAPVAGGTTARSDGAYWIPNNHYMRARGIADPKQDAINYMVYGSYPTLYREDQPRYGIGEHEYALIETYYDNAAPVVESLEAAGAIKSTIVDLPDYLDHAPQNKATHGRILLPVKPDGQIGQGRELVRQLKAWLDAKQVPFLLRHAATGLERNVRGEVIGLAANSPEGPVFLRANKGVVFGSGGYTHDSQLVVNFQPGPIFGGCAVPTNQGDFIRIGIEAGAMLGNMVNAWRAQLVLESALESASVPRDIWQPPGDSMILVNKFGRRVVDEKRNYHERTRVHFVWDSLESEYTNKLLFMIYDRRTAELFAGNYPLPEPGDAQRFVITAPNVGALALAIQDRLNLLAPQIGRTILAPDFAATLAAQIESYSADAKRGVDGQFHRGKYPYDTQWHSLVNSKARTDTQWPPNPGPNVTVHPIDEAGPLFAIILAAGTLDTNGGPVINAKGQVIDTRGRPIPGLYGAGNCIASPAGQAYWGAGGTLGPALTFGTLCGQSVSAEPAKADS